MHSHMLANHYPPPGHAYFGGNNIAVSVELIVLPCVSCPSSWCLVQLAQLAEALGRHLVVPNPPCDSKWLDIGDNAPNRNGFNLSLWTHYHNGFQVGVCGLANRYCWGPTCLIKLHRQGCL